MKTFHEIDGDTDRCFCGGQIVYFEDGDRFGRRGEGCEVAERVFGKVVPCEECGHTVFRPRRGPVRPCSVCGEPSGAMQVQVFSYGEAS